MKKDLNKFELIIDENEDSNTGVYAISIVSDPAIEQEFYMFSSQKEENTIVFSQDSEQQIITGPVLIPDKLIYRRKGGREYEVFMTADTIKKTAIKFFKKHFNNNTTLEHKKSISDTTYFESWIVDDINNDKKNQEKFNNVFKDIPVGSWMVSLKVNDSEQWNKIKKDGFTGFSIEGLFNDHLVENSNQIKNNNINMKRTFWSKFKNLLFELEKEINFIDLTLKDGGMLHVDESGSVFMMNPDGSMGDPAKDGDYILEDDSILTVKDGKKVEMPTDAPTEAKKEEVKAEEVKVKYSAIVTLKDGKEVSIDDTLVARYSDGTMLEDGDYVLITDETLTVLGGQVQMPDEPSVDASKDEMSKIKEEFSSVKSNLEEQIEKLKQEIVELSKQPMVKPIGNYNQQKQELSFTERVLNNLKRMDNQ